MFAALVALGGVSLCFTHLQERAGVPTKADRTRVRPRGNTTMKPVPASPTNIDEYIAAFPRDVQDKLRRVRATVRRAAPDVTEAIKYGIPTFLLGGNLVHFGAFKTHVGFYPTPSGLKAFEFRIKEVRQKAGLSNGRLARKRARK